MVSDFDGAPHFDVKMKWRRFLHLSLLLKLQRADSFVSVSRPRALVSGAPNFPLHLSTRSPVDIDEKKLQSSEMSIDQDVLVRELESQGDIVSELESAVLALPDGNNLQRWQRRLITREDPFSIHKLSSIAYSISAIIILGTAAVRYLDSHRDICSGARISQTADIHLCNQQYHHVHGISQDVILTPKV